jgi:2'-5' RNA ligase
MEVIAIICLLSREVNNYCLDLRQKIVGKFGLQANHYAPPHITLKYGFPVEVIGEVEEVVEPFFLSQPKSMWKLRDFGYFMNDNNHVVFIDAIPTEETRKVHAALLDSLRKIKWVKWGQFDKSDLHYHITLVSNGITSKNFAEVWSFINQLEKPDFEVHFNNLALFRIEKEPPFVYSLFRFPE